MNDEDHLEAFSDWLSSWGASPTTSSARLTVVRAFLRDYGPPARIRREDVETWLAGFGAQWTKVTYFSHVHSYFGWLVDTGRITSSPTAKLRRPRSPKGVPRPLSEHDVGRILAAANPNMTAWMILGLYAGMRAHEIAKIRGEDVDENALFIHGKGGKSAMIPTHPIVWELAQQKPRRGWWFPGRSACGHILPTTVSTSATRLFTSLGIEGSIHRARHSYGTNLMRAGANLRTVQQLMRHDSLATTEIYTKVTDDELRSAIGRLAAA